MELLKYIPVLLYGMVLLGVFFLFEYSIYYLVKQAGHRLSTFRRKEARKSKIYAHIFRLMETVSKEGRAERNVRMLLMISFAVFFMVSVMLVRQGFGSMSILVGILLSGLPYAYVRSKLSAVRINGSYEGESVISEFVNQYKLSSKNIISAIDATASALTEKEPVAKKAFYKMSLLMKLVRNEEEVQKVLDDFVYTTDTEWAKSLSNNIYNAMVEKVDIVEGLEDLLRECKKINESLESVKRDNMEAVAMIKYAGPLFFVGFAYLTKASSGLTWTQVAKYEFGTPTGLLLFIGIMVMLVANAIIANLLTRQKYDI